MKHKLHPVLLAIALFAASGCEAEQPVEIPENPAPPPKSQPRGLDNATSDKQTSETSVRKQVDPADRN